MKNPIIPLIFFVVLIKVQVFSQSQLSAIQNGMAGGQAYKQLSDSTLHYTSKGDYKTALQWGEKALQQTKKEFGKKDTLYADALTVLFEICFYSVKYENAIAYSIEEISIRKEIQGERHLAYATAINKLAELYKIMGRYPEAEELYLKSKEIRKTTLGENHADYGSSLNNLAWLYLAMGRYPESEELFLRSKEIYHATLGENHLAYASSLNNLASLYETMGRYPEAEELYLKSKEIRKTTLGENHYDYAQSLNNLAGLYRIVGRYPEAEELFLKSKEILQTALGENHPYYATSLNNLAGLYRNMGRYPESEELYLKSKEILQTVLGENHPYYVQSLNNLAGLYKTIGRYPEAEAMYLRLKKILQTKLSENYLDYATFLNNLAMFYQTIDNRYPEAEELFLKSKEIRKTILGENHPNYTNSLNNLAALYEKTGSNKEANIYFQQALQKNIFHINAYFPGMSEKEKGQFFNTLKGNFEHYYSFGKQQFTNSNEWVKQIPVNIMNCRFATKGLLFNSSNKMRENILNSGDTTLVLLFRTWKSKRDYLAKLFTLNKEEIEKQGISLEGLQKEINDIEKGLSKKSTLFDKETEKKETTWQDVQSQLKESEAFVEMIRFRKFSTATGTIHYKDSSWHVKKDGFTDTVLYAALILKPPSHKVERDLEEDVKLVILENGNELEEMYYGGYKLAIKHFQPYKDGYIQYWERIAKELQNMKTVYFSGDGVYNQINLNTLQNPQTGKFLLEEMDIHFVTSAKDMMRNRKLEDGRQKLGEGTASLYGYANYDNNIASEDLGDLPVLPGTQKEVTTIEALLKEKNWTTKMYQWDQSSEGAVKSERSPTVLHIATHGYFLTDSKIKGRKILGIDSIYYSLNPLLKSGLLLAVDTATKEKEVKHSESGLGLYGKEEDGILTAYEAMNLNLDNTELVVLSACETGLGNQIHGEGVFGLQRAFQQAGAKTVIMSLWTVSDQHTQELMTLFYTKWLSGKDKTEAFKQTQEEMKAKYVHPYFWGAFVMVGN